MKAGVKGKVINGNTLNIPVLVHQGNVVLLTNTFQNVLLARESLKWPLIWKIQQFNTKYEKKRKNSRLVNPLRAGTGYRRDD